MSAVVFWVVISAAAGVNHIYHVQLSRSGLRGMYALGKQHRGGGALYAGGGNQPSFCSCDVSRLLVYV